MTDKIKINKYKPKYKDQYKQSIKMLEESEATVTMLRNDIKSLEEKLNKFENSLIVISQTGDNGSRTRAIEALR